MSSNQTIIFVWKDFSRFIEVYPVRQGWLIVWGYFEDEGAQRVILGNQIYSDLSGVRQRFLRALEDLINPRERLRRPDLISDALVHFDRFPFPAHDPAEPLPPL